MTNRIAPRELDPGAAADGSYALTVAGGKVTGLTAAAGGGGSGITLLTSTHYNPGTVTEKTTTSTSFVDVDASLSITFTATTTRVLVLLTAPGTVSTATAAGYWNLRNASGDITGTARLASSGAVYDVRTVMILVTGLTVGNSYTWKWGHRIHNASFSARIAAGGANGPASMYAFAV